CDALIAEHARPSGLHRPIPRSALAATDDPMQPAVMAAQRRREVEWSEQRLTTQQAHGTWGLEQEWDTLIGRALILDAGPQPDIRERFAVRIQVVPHQVAHAVGALGQDDEDVLWTARHYVEELFDEAERHILVEGVAHAVDEGDAGLLPMQRIVHSL